MDKYKFTITISDGYVDSKYAFYLPETNSIHTILGAICCALHVDVPEAECMNIMEENND